eukprot:c17721_g1_i2 orf=287-4810(-)
METGIDTEVVEYQHAKVVGIQFGLLSTKDAMKISVFHKNGEPDLAAKRKLTDSRLGLPNAESECKSCGERVSQKCEGHFGHIVFPYPVYHPNHVSNIVKILDSLCLSCLSLKKIRKKKPREVETLQDMINGTSVIGFDDKATVHKGNLDPARKESSFDPISFTSCSTMPLRTKEEPEQLNSMTSLDDGGSSQNDRMSISHPFSEKDEAVKEQASRGTSLPIVIDLISDDEDTDVPCLNDKIPLSDTCVPEGDQDLYAKTDGAALENLKEIPMKKKLHLNKEKAKDGGVPSAKKSSCKYCKHGEYPKVHVKLERNVQSSKSVVEKICLELNEDDDVPDDYLRLLGKTAEDFDSGQQYLLPSEALRILTSLTDNVVRLLKMDGIVSRPEALVLESLLIPPNCNRIPEKPGADQLRLGSDKVTNMLAKVLTKLPVMKASKATVMTNRIAIDEMQCLLADYFRIKGGPKVRGSKEPSSDYVRTGKPAKQRPKASLNNLQKHFAAKVSSFSCRAVLTGDTFLSLDEIGIPFEIAKGMTVCETVTKENLERMQEVVNNGPNCLTKTGALHYIRGGEKKYLTHCDLVTVEIGDIIGRHLQDGDYVFCNRPPSVHKHSMLGLRVHVLDIPTIAINPLVCSPLGADFDGDCLAVFVPQSVESKTEVKELMMVQRQMLTSHGGQCTFMLTQDALLAAYKLTSSHTFLAQQRMEQGCMSTGSILSKPAIIKSPKGPFWTGTQFFQLSLPANLDYTKNGVLISDSEILVMTGQPEWLGSSSDSLLQTIILQFGGDIALKYLGSSQLMLVQWISQSGFSVGPYDAYATACWSTRADMKREMNRKMDEKEGVVNKKLQNLNSQLNDPFKQDSFGNWSRNISIDQGANSLGMFMTSLEKLGLQYMQRVLAEVEDVALKHACVDNSILAMVTAGSKGSIKKFVEQFGFLGLQLHKGKYMHPIKRVQPLDPSMRQDTMGIAQEHPSMHQDTMDITQVQSASTWKEGGLVRSSFVEGLNPHEFFIHTVSYREGMIHQALRVSEPGYLYKNMMLFARDVCIDYDGTVRNHHGKQIIQFQYGGAKEYSDHSQSTNQTDKSRKSLPSSQWDDSVLAGEPVGILAATAIVQPAYKMLMESPNQLNDLAFCPLELLQETLYSRKSSVLKYCDQRVVLYVLEAHGYSKEKAAVKVHGLLQHVTLEMLLKSLSVNFTGDFHGGVWEGLRPAKKSPWIVHLSLHKLALRSWNVTVEGIVEKLKSVIEIHEFGNLSFLPRECCDSSCPGSTQSESNPCISFCTTIAQSPSIEESLSRIRNHVIPRVMKVSIMGDGRIESVSIVPSDLSSEPWMCHVAKDHNGSEQHDELAIEVLVKKSWIRKKSDAWHIVQELCGPVRDLIDWSRSIPNSIQGVASLYGIEAAHNYIYQRLKSVLTMFDKTVYTQHVLLMTDLMTHSGYVVGLNAAGFREFSNTLHVSAPMTQSLFQNSIKHIQEAAFKGKCDDLSGTLPSICMGKPAPVGTGAKFDILWRIVD